MSELYAYDNRPTNVNELSNELIVLHNMLARKSTRWNALELKLFYAVISRIRTRDENNVVRLKKADLCDVLNIDPANSHKLREQFKKVSQKSWVEFDGKTEQEWKDGFLVIDSSSDRSNVYVSLNRTFIPLLLELEKHFTSFYLDNIGHFKSKNSVILFQNLKSWFNRDYLVTHKKYSLVEMKRMFEIGSDDYMVKRGKNKDHLVFDTFTFKARTIDVAVQEINADVIKSGMRIGTVETIKHRGFVWGYDFEFTLVDSQGRIWNPENRYKKEDPLPDIPTIDDYLK